MIDILIPVLGRPERIPVVYASAMKSTSTPHRVIFICSPGDSEAIEACAVTGATNLLVSWPPGRADFAKKINWAYSQFDGEWVFQGATDILFSPGWDEEALRYAALKGRRVIGTNDLHNPGSRRGQTSTHILFARSYIEEYGGTKDGTGTVFCELYDHQYVDNEFIDTARQRREWYFCRGSVVEHFHPHWGNAEEDDTYRKALRSSDQDRRLYMMRNRGGLTPHQERLERMRKKRAKIKKRRPA